MFDKITISSKVSNEKCFELSKLHHLQIVFNEEGEPIKYISSKFNKINGNDVTIKGNIVKISTSLHKYWNKRNYGELRNDNKFTISEAKLAFEMLLYENGLKASETKIIYYEVGLNMHVSYDPLEFIELAKFVPLVNKEETIKLMFCDANYRQNRQKTSEKHKDIRKYFKIYDKGWEMNDKVRSKNNEHKIMTDNRILRIETVNKRGTKTGDKFFSDGNLCRIVSIFYKDWKKLFFSRDIRAYKGARKSEIDRAKILVNLGAEEYLLLTKKEFQKNKITEKQYRTIREFIRDFEKNKNLFKIIISQHEKEYTSLLNNVLAKVRT